MNKVAAIVVTALLFVLAFNTAALLKAEKQYKKEKRHNSAISSTLLKGHELNILIEQYRLRLGKYPSYTKFQEVADSIFSPTIRLEYVSAGQAKPVRLTDIMDGQGGWFYDEQSGQLKLNWTNLVEASDGTKINFSEVTYFPQIKLPSALQNSSLLPSARGLEVSSNLVFQAVIQSFNENRTNEVSSTVP